jgi:hypothetical protein
VALVPEKVRIVIKFSVIKGRVVVEWVSRGNNVFEHHFITLPKILPVKSSAHDGATTVKDARTAIYSALMIPTAEIAPTVRAVVLEYLSGSVAAKEVKI